MHSPSPALLAQQMLNVPDPRPFRNILPHVVAMAGLETVADENAYEIVATVRQGITGWRTIAARDVKRELDTLLTLYRVDRWR